MANILSNTGYHPILTIKDKNFNTTSLSKYHLSICVNDTSFKVSCINPTTTQCLLLEVYSLAPGSMQKQIQAIEQLYQDHPLLGATDWESVTLCIGNQQYTLIPKEFVQENTVADYLKFTCPIGSNTIQYFTHTSLNIAVAFAIDPLLLNWFQKTYQQTTLRTIHQASSFIEATLAYLRGSSSDLLPQLLSFFEDNHLHIIIIQKDKLLYYNRFEYTNIDELLYYILSVMHALQLDPSLHKVVLGGNISKSSTAYQKACNYIRKLSFIGKPSYLRFGRAFDRNTLASYLDILSTHLC